jgi:hypothetical protein
MKEIHLDYAINAEAWGFESEASSNALIADTNAM